MKKQVKAELVPMSIPEGGSSGEFLCIMKGTSSLLLIDYDCCLPKAEYWDPMQLIITDESEVKKGSKVNVDKCIGTVISITGTFCEVDLGWSTTQLKPISDCKVIISAYPLIEGVCPVSVQFLNNYAAANGKGEVWAAYGTKLIGDLHWHYAENIILLDPNGCAVLELRAVVNDTNKFPTMSEVPQEDVVAISQKQLKEILIHFLDGIRDYEHESKNAIYLDERGSLEFVDIYLAENHPSPPQQK